MSIVAYDKAMRQIKAKSFNWSYDEGIGVANLQMHIKDDNKDSGKARARGGGKKITKRKDRESFKSTQICYNYAKAVAVRVGREPTTNM